MSDNRATQRIVDACVGMMGRYQPHQLLTWMVADVLAGFDGSGTHWEVTVAGASA